MEVTVTFIPEKADLRRVGYIGLRARPTVFWSGVSFFIFLPLILAVIAVFLNYGNSRFNWIPVYTLLVVPVFIIVSFYNIPVIFFGKSPVLNGEHTYTFTDAEINAKSPTFDSRISWAIITACYTHPFGILFYSGKIPVISIPRRALSRSSEGEILRAYPKILIQGIANEVKLSFQEADTISSVECG